ncbi:NAD(+)/NADH kinase [Amycolatopsis sp. NBC_01488]|uniref:NAD(+)/NADH kinase n=1 Tax=Amycolatopsis sp. NBC_01488 TaxID=2903563 RepID=UPI002E293EDB|nr:NAD(+)/NADH kinase [Amycolatopsis sp. NBC_01488]
MPDSEITRVGVVAHPRKPVRESVEVLVSHAARHGIELVVRETDAAQAGTGVAVVSDTAFAGGVDAIVSLGGDGTMLGALRLAVDRPVPVLGVNYGNVGFLVEIAPPELAGARESTRTGGPRPRCPRPTRPCSASAWRVVPDSVRSGGPRCSPSSCSAARTSLRVGCSTTRLSPAALEAGEASAEGSSAEASWDGRR